MLVPDNIAPWLWGWPHRFMTRMNANDDVVVLLGRYDDGEFSTGIDTPEQFAAVPKLPGLGVWTNRIEVIADDGRSRPH